MSGQLATTVTLRPENCSSWTPFFTLCQSIRATTFTSALAGSAFKAGRVNWAQVYSRLLSPLAYTANVQEAGDEAVEAGAEAAEAGAEDAEAGGDPVEAGGGVAAVATLGAVQ